MATRRSKGEGMIRKKDGRWEGRIVVGHKDDDSPIFRYIYAKTQKELTEKMHRKFVEYEGVELTSDSNMTLGEWFDIWYEKYAKPTIRETTLMGYKKGLEKHRNNASMFFMCHNLKKMAIWRWKYKKKRLIFIFFKNNNF